MKEVIFTFRNKSHRGLLATSTERYPHYYWCYIDDPELVNDLGDCISFKQEEGRPLEPSEYYPPKYAELVQTIKTILEQIVTAGTVA